MSGLIYYVNGKFVGGIILTPLAENSHYFFMGLIGNGEEGVGQWGGS